MGTGTAGKARWLKSNFTVLQFKVRSNSNIVFNVLIISFGFIGVGKLVYATAEGIGISPDSTIYLGGAKSFQEKGQLQHPFLDEPITNFPPLYPLTISIVAYLFTDLPTTARVINFLLYPLIILLGSRIIYEVTNGHWVATLIGTLLIISANDLLRVHVWAWSEPLFIFLGFSGLYFIINGIELQKQYLIILSSVLVGLSILTRYAGIVFFITGLFALGFYFPKKYKERIKVISQFCLVALLPISLWLIRNFIVNQTATNREFNFHFITLEQLYLAIQTIRGWFITYPQTTFLPSVVINFVFIFLLVLLMVIIFISLVARESVLQISESVPRIIPVLFFFFFSYFGFLILSISFFDAYTPLNNRILAPAYFAILPVFVFLLNRLREMLSPSKLLNRLLTVSIFLIVSLTVFLNWVDQSEWISNIHDSGLGYNSKAWKSSETVKYLNTLPSDIQIISNAPDALYFLTGRLTSSLPLKFNPSTKQDNPNYYKDLESIRNLFITQKAYLILFDTTSRDYLPTEGELVNSCGLTKIRSFSDGNLYICQE